MTDMTPSRLFDVRIEYLGRKKFDTFELSTICLGREGDFMVMDSEGMRVLFMARSCRVEQIAAHVIIIHGFTDYPRHITAYCVYANAKHEGQDEV